MVHVTITKRCTAASLVVMLAFFAIGFSVPSYAACPGPSCSEVTSRKDTLSRQKTSELSDHMIAFTTPSGLAAGKTITVTFPAGFSIPVALDFTDIDLSYGATGIETNATLAATASGTTWGASFTGQTLTLTSGTATIAAGDRVIIKIGTNATTGSAGDQQITNPGAVNVYVISVGGTFGDSGEMAVPIIDSDQVATTAVLDPVMVFDVDVGTTSGESSSPYTFDLGELDTSLVTTSGAGTPERPRVFIDLKTSAPGGATVTVQGAHGGIFSPSQSHTITTTDSGTAVALTGGTEGFGLCVASTSSTSGTIAATAPFNGACSTTSHEVGGLTTSPREIINTANAPAMGTDNNSAQIFIKAAVSNTTPAATDYTETISFAASGIY